METQDNVILIGSVGTVSTGTNIKNLHNIVFASPSKSRVRNLQAIGRVLRLNENKDKDQDFFDKINIIRKYTTQIEKIDELMK